MVNSTIIYIFYSLLTYSLKRDHNEIEFGLQEYKLWLMDIYIGLSWVVSHIFLSLFCVSGSLVSVLDEGTTNSKNYDKRDVEIEDWWNVCETVVLDLSGNFNFVRVGIFLRSKECGTSDDDVSTSESGGNDNSVLKDEDSNDAADHSTCNRKDDEDDFSNIEVAEDQAVKEE